jgi:hypothetical protein
MTTMQSNLTRLFKATEATEVTDKPPERLVWYCVEDKEEGHGIRIAIVMTASAPKPEGACDPFELEQFYNEHNWAHDAVFWRMLYNGTFSNDNRDQIEKRWAKLKLSAPVPHLDESARDSLRQLSEQLRDFIMKAKTLEEKTEGLSDEFAEAAALLQAKGCGNTEFGVEMRSLADMVVGIANRVGKLWRGK